MVKKGMHR